VRRVDPSRGDGGAGPRRGGAAPMMAIDREVGAWGLARGRAPGHGPDHP
jgi:hypothetical protein